MKYAVLAPVGANVTANPRWLTEFAQHVEDCGFESIVVVEHPVVLAKRVATVDRLSGGRVRLCVGVGWMREETQACGIDFASRGRRGDESIDVMRALWAASGPEGASHKGEFFAFDQALSYPKPSRTSGVPIHIGGHSPAAARRAGLRGDGFQPLGLRKTDLIDRITVMRATAERAGRDPSSLEITLGHQVGRITESRAADLAELGATRILLSPTPVTDLDQVKDELSVCAARLDITPRHRGASHD